MFAGEALKGSEEAVPREEQSSGNKASLKSCLEAVGGLYLVARAHLCAEAQDLHCVGCQRGVVLRNHPWGGTRALHEEAGRDPALGLGRGEYLGISACGAQDGIPTCYFDPISHLPPLLKEHSALQGSPARYYPPPTPPHPEAAIYRLAVGGDDVQREKTIRPSFSLQEAIR